MVLMSDLFKFMVAKGVQKGHTNKKGHTVTSTCPPSLHPSHQLFLKLKVSQGLRSVPANYTTK